MNTFYLFRAVSTAVAVIGMLGPVARAAEDPCATQRSTKEINACAQRNFEAADVHLASTYERVLSVLTEPDGLGRSRQMERESLKKAQNHWQQFRDDNCHVVLLMNADGRVRTSQYLKCKEELTRERINHLERWFLQQKNN